MDTRPLASGAPPDPIKKDLILREKLALQRTVLAIQSTFLSFLRTSMYFLIAGLSVSKLLEVEHAIVFEIVLFSVSGLVLVIGIINHFTNQKKVKQSQIHIGNYKFEFENSNLQEITNDRSLR
jgi:putative membrane protein